MDHISTQTDTRRVLHWVYARGDDRITCELLLDVEALVYEFRTASQDRSAAPKVERFRYVGGAFEHQSRIERRLISEGWSLERFESLVVVVDSPL